MTVRVKDNGANALLKNAKNLAKGPSVDVGILGSDGAKTYAEGGAQDGGVTVAMIAEWAEYGIGQPERSWLRAWIDGAQAQINQRLSIETKAVIAGTRTQAQALARIGVWSVGEIQKRIAAGIAPENAPSTIERKGSSTPLIDKGQFRSSITSKVNPK